MLKNIPDQEVPIFDFHIADDGEILKTAHVKYIVQKYQTGIGTKTRYMIHKDTCIVTKTPEQMDRYLSGHFFTFIDDPERARSAMLGYYEQKLHLAELSAANCREMLALLTKDPSETDDTEEENET